MYIIQHTVYTITSNLRANFAFNGAQITQSMRVPLVQLKLGGNASITV